MPKSEGDIFNVGNDHEITIEELAFKVKEMTSSDLEIEYIPYEKPMTPASRIWNAGFPTVIKYKG